MKNILLLFLISVVYIEVNAQNPIIKDFGMADPHIYIFNEKAYLFSTRDADSTAKDFIMPDWHIWSSDDLVNWHYERVIKPSETYMGKGSTKCWATETVEKNEKYYFYFSNGNESTGVMVADKPEGPYKDVLGKPLLAKDLTPGLEYDPTVLVEEDGTAYICFGWYLGKNEDMRYYIAKLSDDMISLQEKPKAIVLNKEGGFYNDKPNLHKFNGKYYLSAGSLYAISDTIYGPYDYVGNSGNGNYGLTRQAHGNYFTWKNQWFHTWCKFHLDSNIKFRESYITYLHYKDNGEMVDDINFLEKHFATGVGRYDANWDKIEAEWYMKAGKVNKAESPNGSFEIQKIQNGGTLYFPNIANLSDKETIQFYVSATKKGSIEIRDKNETGNILGICNVTGTGGFKSYKLLSCDLDGLKNVNDICFVFKGKSTDILHLDWFSFK
ncbi:carbohydrate binding protein with CBM6 domain [Jejuia pallidilutea]|uniref:Carbohydrate binding protein with CBM6 domain n=1 Tax=Jejuia pallidilutea TaxID=504487 RepID=A0A362X7Q8_9FLAO|nr:family 43 glycosylhydrolase [Jejuia pallidilutea]PQV51483.1 carbohydrate binding protein with CBM6 domain [Jejuia pallidilutea]